MCRGHIFMKNLLINRLGSRQSFKINKLKPLLIKEGVLALKDILLKVKPINNHIKI